MPKDTCPDPLLDSPSLAVYNMSISNTQFIVLGSVLRCDVTGKVLMKCFLSGMPDLKLGLNDKIGLEKEAQLKSRPNKR